MKKPTKPKRIKIALQGKITDLATMLMYHSPLQNRRLSPFIAIQLMHQCERSSVSELHKHNIDMESRR